MAISRFGDVAVTRLFVGPAGREQLVVDGDGRFVGPTPESPAAPAAEPGPSALRTILPIFLQTPRDAVLFVAPGACEVVSIQAAAGTPGGARSAVDVVRISGEKTESLLTKPFGLRKTDVLTGELVETRSLEAGDRLAVNFTGTLGDLADVALTIELRLQ